MWNAHSFVFGFNFKPYPVFLVKVEFITSLKVNSKRERFLIHKDESILIKEKLAIEWEPILVILEGLRSRSKVGLHSRDFGIIVDPLAKQRAHHIAFCLQRHPCMFVVSVR